MPKLRCQDKLARCCRNDTLHTGVPLSSLPHLEFDVHIYSKVTQDRGKSNHGSGVIDPVNQCTVRELLPVFGIPLLGHF